MMLVKIKSLRPWSWSAATRRRFPNHAATSRRTPQTHPSGLTMTKAVFDVNSDGIYNKEYLTFILGEEEYAIDILKVKEIRGYGQVTRIPGTPEFIKGVANIRGLIVPIIDLRIKFNLGIPIYDSFTTVIILDINNRLVGIVTSSVSDVITLSLSQIQSLPDCSFILKSDYLLGLASVDERMIILIDADKLMTSRETALIDKSDL